MSMKVLIPILAVALGASIVTGYLSHQRSDKVLAAARDAHSKERLNFQAEAEVLKQKLEAAERERDKLKADAAEVHKLRGEISTLRKANEALQKAPAPQQAKATPKPAVETPNATIPASLDNYSDVAQFAAKLRAKGGQLSPEELQWAQSMKPELDKLEASPENFAAFQASMIQATAGVTDPQKAEQIRTTIQRVYENAVKRGLNLQARPEDDAAWVQQRHQLDRRGTTAIQNLLDENERAAFDRSFLGIMGVDLGTGVDKTLYPPGFIRETPISR